MKTLLCFGVLLLSLSSCHDEAEVHYTEATTFFGQNDFNYHTGYQQIDGGGYKSVIWKADPTGKKDWVFELPYNTTSSYNQVEILSNGSILIWGLSNSSKVFRVSENGEEIWKTELTGFIHQNLIHTDDQYIWISCTKNAQSGVIKISIADGTIDEEIFPPAGTPSYLIGSLTFGYTNDYLFAVGIANLYKPLFLKYNLATKDWESSVLDETMTGSPAEILFEESNFTVVYTDNEFLKISYDGNLQGKFSLTFAGSENTCFVRHNFLVDSSHREFLVYVNGAFKWITVDDQYNTISVNTISENFDIFHIVDEKVLPTGLLLSISEYDTSLGVQHFILFKPDGSFEHQP